MSSWNTLRSTPEDIVARIGNIANRSDINETQAIQALEIRGYAAHELEKIADDLYHNKTSVAEIRKRAEDIRKGL